MDSFVWSRSRHSDHASKVMAIAEALAVSYGGSVEFTMTSAGNYTANFMFPDSVSPGKEIECIEKFSLAVEGAGGEVVD